MKALVIGSVALFGMLPGFHAPAMALEKITSADGLELMRWASLEEVLEVFTGEDYQVKVPDNPRGVVNFRTVSVVDKASAVLVARLEKAREPLVKLLESGTPEVRGRALKVLAQGEPASLEMLKPKVLPMLKDTSLDVRKSAIELLKKVKDDAVETAMVEAIRVRDPLADDGNAYSEISRLIEIVCDQPLSAERVIPSLLPWLDETKANSRVVGSIIRATTPFSKSGPYAERLTEAYWRILSTIRDDDSVLVYPIVKAWEGDAPLALAYLRQTPGIANDKARSEAAAALIGHRDFDPQKESALLDGLLNDRAWEVRRAALLAMFGLKSLPLRLRIGKALPFLEADPAAGVREAAATGILGQIRRLPDPEADVLLTDPSLGLADRMLTGLKDEELGRRFALATGVLSGNFHEFISGLKGDGQVAKAIAWWEDVKKGKVNRLPPRPPSKLRDDGRPPWTKMHVLPHPPGK